MSTTRFDKGTENLKIIDGKAGGCEPQLEVHINGALNVGISPEKIVETFLQCIPYTGFPKVLNAISVAKKVFSEGEIKLNIE